MTSNPLLDNGARVAPPYGSWGAQTPTAASVAMDSTSNTQGQRDSRASESYDPNTASLLDADKYSSSWFMRLVDGIPLFHMYAMAPVHHRRRHRVQTLVLLTMLVAAAIGVFFYFSALQTQVDEIVPNYRPGCIPLGRYFTSSDFTDSHSFLMLRIVMQNEVLPTLEACRSRVIDILGYGMSYSRSDKPAPDYPIAGAECGELRSLNSQVCLYHYFMYNTYSFPIGNGNATVDWVYAMQNATDTDMFTDQLFDFATANPTANFTVSFSVMPGFFRNETLGTARVVPYVGRPKGLNSSPLSYWSVNISCPLPKCLFPGYDLTRQLSWAKFSNFTPSDVQLAVRFQSTESIDAADATFSGNGSLGVCADWADATAPFHCVYERKEYNTFAALSLTASVVTAFIPVMVLIIKVATPVRD